MPLKVKIIFYLGCFIIGFILGWRIEIWREANAYKTQYQKILVQTQKAVIQNNNLSKGYNETKTNYITAMSALKQEKLNENMAYVNCSISPNSVHTINAAIRKTNNLTTQ